MFSKEWEQQVEFQFEQKLLLQEDKKKEIRSELARCTREEEIIMKFLYSSMPLSDIGNYSFQTYLDYAKHGIFLWNQGNFSKKIPQDIFLNYVLYHRVNEEDISECRDFFYRKLADRIAGMNMMEAALEVNYWCAEEATYQSTDDRTVSPMTVYRSGFGRCGEESTFTVSALRSVGIPARQVYVPRWSHCDDNHAWVEVWCDGSWFFLGACEPEEILNKGWFTNASSRAMLVHSRWYTNTLPEEEVIGKDGMVTFINTTSHYSLTRKLTVTIVDTAGNPVENAVVDFEVLNYSEFFPVATMITGQDGSVTITLGLGNIHIHVSRKGSFVEKIVDIREDADVILVLSEKIQENDWLDMNITVPADHPVNSDQPTKEQKKEGDRRLKDTAKKRLLKVEAFYSNDRATSLIKNSGVSEDVVEILKESRGNYSEIEKFLLDGKEAGLQYYKEKMLKSLSKKDYRDCKSDILMEHLRSAIKYKNKYEEEIFLTYLLNPRVQLEPLCVYRDFINEYYSEEEKNTFRNDPVAIWEDINHRVHDYPELEYHCLVTSSVACLKMKAGSCLSKKILFVTICRSLGIPARLNQMDLSMEFYKDGEFHPVISGNHKNSILRLRSDDPCEKWSYLVNWSIGKLENGTYHTLNLSGREWMEEVMEINLEAGHYRIITSNRIPNGNIYAKKYYFRLSEGEKKEITLSLRETTLRDMLVDIQLSDFNLYEEDGSNIKASKIAGNEKNLFLWLEESKEPTEHILNELYERRDAFHRFKGNILFIVKEKSALQDPTIGRTLKGLPGVKVYYDTFAENVNLLGRRMYVDPEKLPLIIGTNNGLTGIYATNGYNVGTGDMLLRIFNMLE